MRVAAVKSLAVAASAATLFAFSSVGAMNAGDMEAAFGNTIVTTYPDGGWVRHWFDRDGSYRAHFRDGRRLTGVWSREGDRLCINNIRPRMLIGRFCQPMIRAEVGDTWSSRDPIGRRVQAQLVEGRQER